MKHLKTFEFYFYDQEEEMDGEGKIMPPFGEEEEAEDNPGPITSNLYGMEYDDDDDDDPYEYEHFLRGIDPETSDEDFQKKIASYKDHKGSNESSCPSCNCQECECDGMANEAKKSKSSSYKKSGLKNPEKADLNKDKKLSGYEKTRGKAIQKSVQSEKEEKSPKSKGKLTKAQEKLPEALKRALKSGVRD